MAYNVQLMCHTGYSEQKIARSALGCKDSDDRCSK